MNLPNLITIARILLAVVIVPLLFVDRFGPRLLAFIIFLVAAFSDLWDGHIARSRGLITNLGKLLDPIADKLLLTATFVPFYILSHRPGPLARFPWFGDVLPLWIVLVIFGASGDLTKRKLIPALYHRFKDGQFDEQSRIIGVSRSKLSDADAELADLADGHRGRRSVCRDGSRCAHCRLRPDHRGQARDRGHLLGLRSGSVHR